MANDNSAADPANILDLLEAFRRSKTMFAAVSLGVFDALESRPKTLSELAGQLSANADALERLLDACVGLRLLRKENGNYQNTAGANIYLTSNSPQRLTGYINYSNNVLWRLWANLEDAVREGTNRWQQVYGWNGPIFAHLFHDEAAKREFLMGMHGYGLMSSPKVVAAFDLSRFRCICDLGGATGQLAIAACQRYPQLRGVVFDLREAVPLSNEMVGASPVADRIDVVAGDFFANPLPECDLFAVARILHDWSEEKIIHLLAHIHERLPQNGALLIAEKILSDDKTGPRWAQMQNLNMLTCTEGKERTFAEYTALLTKAGFSEVSGRETDSPLDAILAVKR
jgi:acetylserotonin N-methyltransferase